MSNNELAQIVDTSDEWIYSHTGIKYRHIAEDNQAASDLAVEASRHALIGAGIGPQEIDLILLATSTPDFPGLPSTASVVQDRLGCMQAGAMDVVAACTGFIYSLATARAFIRSGSAKNVLIIGSEIYSKIINWEDRNSCVLFGDGAGAAVVSLDESVDSDNRRSGMIDSYLRSQGSGAESLYRCAGGTRNPYDPGQTARKDLLLSMDGRKVYVFAVQVLIDTIQLLLDRNGFTMDDVDWVVPHQANVRIIDAACKRAGWPLGKFFMNIEEYANTSAASIPIALDEMQQKGLLNRGQLLLLVGFGSGLTYGGNLLRW